eukprot:symbB.v1.2.040366.t1/scaffold7174.1/size12882/1
MTQWAYQDEIVPEEIIPENKRLNVLAENDEFVVVVPPPEATARIRVLEREFALDHADCLRGHSMHLAMAPDEWCGFAGIPVNEADAHKLIFSLLNKGSETQALVCCIHKKSGSLRGYLHLGHFNEQTLEIAYLKVQREFQRRGLASLLLEGGLRLARERRKWTFHEISLNVATRNVNAVRFYESKGFKHCGRPKQCGRPKRAAMSAFSEWSTMKKQEMQDEVEQRDFCVSAFNANKGKVAEISSLKEKHSTKSEMLAGKLQTVAGEISETKGKIEAAQKELTKADEEHKEELSDFNVTLVDQKATQKLLTKALDSLKGFYQEAPALVQSSDVPEADDVGQHSAV